MVEGGTAHGYKINLINCCLYGVPPASIYKGAREGVAGLGGGAPRRSPTPTGSRIPPFQVVGVGVKERGKRREGRRGCSPSP